MVGVPMPAMARADTKSVSMAEIHIAAFFPRSSPFSQAKGRNRLNKKKMANKIEAVHQRKYRAFQAKAKTLIDMMGQAALKGEDSQNVMIYWQLGEYIMREYHANRDNPAYIDFFITSLSVDTQMSKMTLKAMERFYTIYPLAAHISPLLSWAHYRLLIDIQDEEKRMFYQKTAEERSWTPGELEQAIQERLYEKNLETENRITWQISPTISGLGWI